MTTPAKYLADVAADNLARAIRAEAERDIEMEMKEVAIEQARSAEAERDEAIAALEQIASGGLCATCGQIHIRQPDRGKAAGSWADPIDGHSLHHEPGEVTARAFLARVTPTQEGPNQ